MKSKLLLSLLFAIVMGGTILAQQNLTIPGSPNYYEGKYGVTTFGKGPMDALVFIEYVVDPNGDFIVPSLVNLGYTVTMATSWADFDTKLASGAYGLAVGMNQNNWTLPNAAGIQTYLDNGGCMIFTDWTRNNTLAASFEASFTGNVNQSSVTISDPNLLFGLTNPVSLVNPYPGWGVYSMGLSAIGSGEVLATFANGQAAVIRGNGGKTIILGWLSDVPALAIRQQLFENVINVTLCGEANNGRVPISDWAIYLSVFLMVSFLVYRFARAY